jgi:hypothetical protein
MIQSIIDKLDVSPEKRAWIQVYSENHLRNELNPPVEKAPEEKKELSHFEIHPIMAEAWKNRVQI